MSRSFMDSIKRVVTEGAKEKTADGMTRDAKHFRADLHTIKDSGMKHLVQKDSETRDYEKMFNGDVDRAKARLSDQQAPEDLNKYVEYNEEAELEEAKANEEKHDDDCECEDCSSDDVKEAWYNPFTWSMTGPAAGTPGTPPKSKANIEPKSLPGKPLDVQRMRGGAGMQAYATNRDKDFKAPVAAPPQWGKQAAERLRDKDAKPPASDTKPNLVPVIQTNKPKAPGSENAAAGTVGNLPGDKQNAIRDRMYGGSKVPGGARPEFPGKNSPTKKSVSPGAREPDNPPPAKTPKADQIKSKPPKSVAPVQKNMPQAAKPQMSKSQQRERQRRLDKGAVAGPKGTISFSYEIDVNGTSYLVSEAHASAIAAFVEKYGMVNEGTAGEFISKEMKHPEKLTAKGKKQKIKQALAIYYSKKRRGKNP